MTLAIDNQSVEDAEANAVEVARATLPVCPYCGNHIAKVQLVAHLVASFTVDYWDDGKGGIEFDAYSRDAETMDVEPVKDDITINHGSFTAEREAVVVECSNHHSWPEPRLRVRQNHGDEFDWYILPQRPATGDGLVLERLPSGDYAWLRPEAK